MWFVFYLQLQAHENHNDLAIYGVMPRNFTGLRGIVCSPFLHGGWDHLLSNTGPIIILGTLLVMFYRPIWFRSFIMLFFLTGIGLWLGGRSNLHIGASGIIYALASYLITMGLLRKEMKLVSVSFLVIFLYGGIVWGILPVLQEVSWEGHLFGLLAGIVTAYYFRNDGREIPKLYRWEIEEIEEML